MDVLPWFCSLILVSTTCQAFPFLWPSSFVGGSSSGGGTTTTTTTTTHTSGPPHPHAQNVHSITTGSINSPAVVGVGPPQSSHLHVRPTSMGSYLASRPLPPLVGVHHHHQHRPVTGPHTNLHAHHSTISSGHRHHFHMQQPHHHHHHHHSARVLQHHHSHVHPAALHFPLHA